MNSRLSENFNGATRERRIRDIQKLEVNLLGECDCRRYRCKTTGGGADFHTVARTEGQ
jgi:hypothetical protein